MSLEHILYNMILLNVAVLDMVTCIEISTNGAGEPTNVSVLLDI